MIESDLIAALLDVHNEMPPGTRNQARIALMEQHAYKLLTPAACVAYYELDLDERLFLARQALRS